MKKKFEDMTVNWINRTKKINILVPGKLIETVVRQAFYLGFCTTREGYNAECPYDYLAPERLFIEDNSNKYTIENIPRKNQDWEDFSFGDSFKSLQNEAVEAIISHWGRKET